MKGENAQMYENFFFHCWKNEYRTTICVQCVMDIFIIKLKKAEYLSLNAMTHNKKSTNSRPMLLVPLNEYSVLSHSIGVYQISVTEDFPEEAKLQLSVKKN